jgi:hypothetical protein
MLQGAPIIIRKHKSILKKIFFLVPSFILGLTIGLGPPHLMKHIIPFYAMLVQERFIFYSLCLGCILATVALKILIDSTVCIKPKRTFLRSTITPSRRTLLSILLLVLILTSIANMNKIEPSTTNQPAIRHIPKTKIPDNMISYFQLQLSNDFYGRVFPIRAPIWIYMLPDLVDVPIIDGLFPTSRLASILNRFAYVNINDPWGPGVNDEELWRYYIDKSEDLGVLWIVAKSPATITNLIKEKFTLELNTSIFDIWKSKTPVSMFEVREGIEIDYFRPSHTLIELDVRTNELREIDIVVKETYFPYWRARMDGKELSIQQNEDGFITLENVVLPPGERKIILTFVKPFNFGVIVSLASVILIFGILAFSTINDRKKSQLKR